MRTPHLHWLILGISIAGMASAQTLETEPAYERHYEADPLLAAKKRFDQFSDALWAVAYGYSRNRSIALQQRLNFERKFKRRIERALADHRAAFGDEVADHGHDRVLVGRCHKQFTRHLPKGWWMFQKELQAFERYVGLTR